MALFAHRQVKVSPMEHEEEGRRKRETGTAQNGEPRFLPLPRHLPYETDGRRGPGLVVGVVVRRGTRMSLVVSSHSNN